MSFTYPDEMSRWKPLYKWLLAVPHYLVLVALALTSILVVLFGLAAVVVTDSYPTRTRDFLSRPRHQLEGPAHGGFPIASGTPLARLPLTFVITMSSASDDKLLVAASTTRRTRNNPKVDEHVRRARVCGQRGDRATDGRAFWHSHQVEARTVRYADSVRDRSRRFGNDRSGVNVCRLW